jgi:hypothetical protein
VKTSHWHGNVKVTASSGGSGSGGLLLRVVLLVVAVVGGAEAIAPHVGAINVALDIVVGVAVLALGAWKLGPIVWELLDQRRDRAVVDAWSAQVDAALAAQHEHAEETLRVDSERVAELEPPPLVVDMPMVERDALGEER